MYVSYPDKLNSWPDAAKSTFTLIAILNHGKNFAVYCLTSSDMREALREGARSLLARARGGGGTRVVAWSSTATHFRFDKVALWESVGPFCLTSKQFHEKSELRNLMISQ